MSTETQSSESIFKLSQSEKIQLVQDLWDDIVAASAVPLYDWQKEELDRRRQKLKDDPSSALTWEEVKAGIRADNGK